MLHLPIELSLSVLSYLPLPTLCSLSTLSRQWFNLFSANQSTIFHNAAVLHGYIQPEIISLDDALSMCKGSPWDGTADWKDFCRRCFQLHENWEGKGRIVVRQGTPPGSDVYRFNVDEKAGICIATRTSGGLTVTHLFSGVVLWSLSPSYVCGWAQCEYENGYIIFDRLDSYIEVWRLASDFAGDNEGASDSPPDEGQRRASTFATAMHHRYAPRGHFRPWAKLFFPEPTPAFRFVYPTLLCVCGNNKRAFLHDVRTGALVQTIDLNFEWLQEVDDADGICYVDVNERYAFVCEPRALHVFARDVGAEVLRIPSDALMPNVVKVDNIAGLGEPFVAVLPLNPWSDEDGVDFLAAHVSRDSRDLVISTTGNRVVFIRDFERICRGETSIEDAGQVLLLLEGYDGYDDVYHIAFEHGRVCVATYFGLFIMNFGRDPSIDLITVVLVRPYFSSMINYMQLTSRRIYVTWDGLGRRKDVPLYEDRESALEPSLPGTQPMTESFHEAWPKPSGHFSP